MDIVAIIPAYNPSPELESIVGQLSDSELKAVIVVDDGSKKLCDPIFDAVAKFDKVKVLRNAVNLGKGAALKNGLNYVYNEYKDCIGAVTVDADGQHLFTDIMKIAAGLKKSPRSLIIGSREFKNDKAIPLRSKLGNEITKDVFRLLVGKNIHDTQSGLRAIPRSLIPHLLKLNSQRYEFELDMLILCKTLHYQIIEKKINTIYVEDNNSSHFRPIIDSMKIYFVLFRFACVSLCSSAIDYLMFSVAFFMHFGIGYSIIVARIFSVMFNYFFVKKFAFHLEQEYWRTFSKYILLVCFSGFCSYVLIKDLVSLFLISVIFAKLIAESIIFIANFAIQRDFIFIRKKET